MLINNLPFVASDNLSYAWAEVFGALLKPGVAEIPTLIVTVTGFDEGKPHEDLEICEALDQALRERGEKECQTVANTLFPISLWNSSLDREALFTRYLQTWPRVRRIPANRQGTYFQRLIAFGPEENPVNQLNHIIGTYQAGNHRRSALQAAIFDPAKDHSNQRQRGFPCLQHVFFAPEANGRLAVTGVYAKQHIFEKAYGNYLGLCRLGQFMAHEMGLQLSRVSCIANVASLGNYGKTELEPLAHILDQITSN